MATKKKAAIEPVKKSKAQAPLPPPVVEIIKTVRGTEKVRVSKNLKYVHNPADILQAIPKDEIRPFTRTDKANFGIKEKLQALYYVQQLHSHIDNIKIIRGELPMEVNDLSDDIAGLQTRIKGLGGDISVLQEQIAARKLSIKDSQGLIKKYETQQGNVKNNREYESLSKEIEFQQLEIQLSEKRIKEHTYDLNVKSTELDTANTEFAFKTNLLEQKKNELDSIISETQKEEDKLNSELVRAEALIETPLITHFNRIRRNMTNGLAVVSIQRDSCGGCFNKIPPQVQLDIAQSKKITVCEHCGRILIDSKLYEPELN
jgi:predicted  nucleic acid-binding Zn-ribbon protein